MPREVRIVFAPTGETRATVRWDGTQVTVESSFDTYVEDLQAVRGADGRVSTPADGAPFLDAVLHECRGSYVFAEEAG